MKISIIVPTFNRIGTLPRAIDSILSQTRFKTETEFEVIIIDDGSIDGTDVYIKQHYPLLTYVKQANAGVSAARNLGLSLAKGDWIGLLDSDDEWLPHKLEMQFALISETEFKVCHTEEIWIRNGVRVNQMNKHQKAGGEIFDRCLPMCAMSPSSILIHRTVFDHVGVFDENLPACEDYDLWLRICAHYSVGYVSEPCIKKYGGHEDQLSAAFWGMDRFRVLALDKFLSQVKPNLKASSEQAVSALNILQKKNQILLKGARKHKNAELQRACESRIDRLGL